MNKREPPSINAKLFARFGCVGMRQLNSIMPMPSSQSIGNMMTHNADAAIVCDEVDARCGAVEQFARRRNNCTLEYVFESDIIFYL